MGANPQSELTAVQEMNQFAILLVILLVAQFICAAWGGARLKLQVPLHRPDHIEPPLAGKANPPRAPPLTDRFHPEIIDATAVATVTQATVSAFLFITWIL